MKITVINGPNINFIGVREKEIYGSKCFEEIVADITQYGVKNGIDVEVKQSNHEGVLIDWVQEAYYNKVDGIIINAGGYTHTSIALMDALKAIAPIPIIEVHLSDISKREAFRQHSYVSLASTKQICGFGAEGYLMAIDEIIKCAREQA